MRTRRKATGDGHVDDGHAGLLQKRVRALNTQLLIENARRAAGIALKLTFHLPARYADPVGNDIQWKRLGDVFFHQFDCGLHGAVLDILRQ